MSSYLLGVDWGGTRIKLGAVSTDGQILGAETLDTPVMQEIERTYQTLLQLLRGVAKEQGEPPVGVGLALTGVVNPDFGTVLLPGKIRGLEGFPVVSRLREEFGPNIWAENDGVAAMYAEKHVGLARDKAWAAVLTVGTGVGSGIMLDRQILKDPHFMFGGQAGHLVIDLRDDQLCLTGARGTGEMLCSATALALSVRSGLQRGIPSLLSEDYWRNPHLVDFRAIIEKGVARNDRLCVDELLRWSNRLGWLLVNVAHAYAPEVIILAGGAMAAHEYFIDKLREHVAGNTFRYPAGDSVPILVSRLGDHIGVVGAAMMVKERLERHR